MFDTLMPNGHWRGELKAEVVFEAICALHLASYVESPYSDRGGLMLVGPPGQLKTTFLDILDENYHNAIALSNTNAQTLVKMQPQFYNGAIRSLVIPDLQAIYSGDPRTASRVESIIMQLTAEGNKGASWQDSRFQKFSGRCTLFAAMTSKTFEEKANAWEDSGLLRRFLWCSYALKDPDVLMKAIQRWELADLGTIKYPEIPVNGTIKDQLTDNERGEIRNWLKHQPRPNEIQFQLLSKATCVLRWHYQRKRIEKEAMRTMKQFAEALQEQAALVTL